MTTQLIRDLQIPIGDDCVLAADLIKPSGDTPTPVLVTVMPYRRDTAGHVGHADAMEWFAERGYTSVFIDPRGLGGSSGTMLPPLDPQEGRDAAAAIEWIADQPWCDGSIGMWGMSYGGIMTLRTAALRPRGLKAIVPIYFTADASDGLANPNGVRGAMATGLWGTKTLLDQVLPPLRTNPTSVEMESWRSRLDEKPNLVDFWQHGPDDPIWGERAIDATMVDVPALCFSGWRDVFCSGSVRGYEAISTPKHLVAGPWMHVEPSASPIEPAEHRELMLRWWDRWLRGKEDPEHNADGATVFVQGGAQSWREYTAWPPVESRSVVFEAATSSELVYAPAHGDSAPPRWPAVPVSDAVAGTQSGTWYIPTLGYGLPLDEREDDQRAVAIDSERFNEDTVIVGAPIADVVTGPGTTTDRIVVRIVDVAPDGRSYLITTGLAPISGGAGQWRVSLAPTAYQVLAGHRIRVVISSSDFPHIVPALQEDGCSAVLEVQGLRQQMLTVDPDAGVPTAVPAPPTPESDAIISAAPMWKIGRDLILDGVEMFSGAEVAVRTFDESHVYESSMRDFAEINNFAPSTARLTFDHAATVRMTNGRTVEGSVHSEIVGGKLTAHAKVRVGDDLVVDQIWEV
ncbi:CocE/NonD family hydrolase [Tsukamurella tyrosinosolvens]|uniref:CocE/NonD family hydrolase n=1 Tax=Tsukamurella tyrosinosolvens TaxID=57704 RepID=UPI0007916BA2|nr:CocE/NonD family hydrolase [Tsukamurella tyrosinosolvens]KXP08416.1 hypothetical protein AXK59_23740 [Tsukamurella tyrosinosolvens]